MHAHLYVMTHVWKSEDNLWESVFHHVGSRDQTLVVRRGDKCPYLMNHLTGRKKLDFLYLFLFLISYSLDVFGSCQFYW